MNFRSWVDGTPERPLLVLLLSYAVASAGELQLIVVLMAVVAGLAYGVVRGTATIPRDFRLEGREILVIDLVAIALASVALIIIGRWISFFFLFVVLTSESRRVPFPASKMSSGAHLAIQMLGTGFVIPVAGAALAGGFAPGSFTVLWASIPLAIVELLPQPPEEDVEPIAANSALVRSVLALVGLTATGAVLATGVPIGLSPEFGLLGSSVGLVLLAFAWLSLFDPNVTVRLRRGITFVRLAAAALLIGCLAMVALV
ncbi:MAG: hypothetical protein ACLFP4_09850 [Spirochaetales bacterium]